MTLVIPSVIPTVLLNSSPIVTVTLPVAPGVTVMLMTATSPNVILSAFTNTSDATLSTVNCLAADTLLLYLSLPVKLATTVKVALLSGV